MKTETHTPGPWTWVENHPQNACVLIFANAEWGECNIATLHCAPSDDAKQDENGVWGDHPERRANARLIAAAPELLALVKLVHGSFGGGLTVTFSEQDVADFAAAIAKAEGRA